MLDEWALILLAEGRIVTPKNKDKCNQTAHAAFSILNFKDRDVILRLNILSY